MEKINIGSGRDVKKGKDWINLDLHNRFGAEIIHDLNNLPLPFESNKFDYVECGHVLEDFINPIPLMDELVRITKVGGEIEIRVPYWANHWDSIHHQRPFNVMVFYDYLKTDDYKDFQRPLEIKEIKFYTHYLFESVFGLIHLVKRFIVKNLFNFLIKIHPSAVDHTFLKIFGDDISLKVIYKKIKKDEPKKSTRTKKR